VAADPLTVLERALKLGEPAEIRATLSLVRRPLGLDFNLETLSDTELGERLRSELGHLRQARRHARQQNAAAVAMAAAGRLIDTARIEGDVIHLDVGVLFGGALLADRSRHFVALVAPGIDVIVSAAILRRAASVLGRYGDLRAYLTGFALHLRWRAGRGGLDLTYRYGLTLEQQRRVLRVDLSSAFQTPQPLEKPKAVTPWLRGLLDELGWVG
jgi:hypothetical protein